MAALKWLLGLKSAPGHDYPNAGAKHLPDHLNPSEANHLPNQGEHFQDQDTHFLPSFLELTPMEAKHCYVLVIFSSYS